MKSKEIIFNLPNFLTLLRLLLIPIMLFYIFSPLIFFFFIIFAWILDILDGFLARKFKLETKFGFVLDAMVDKSFMLFVLIILILFYNLNLIWAILIFSKDLIILIYRLYLLVKQGLEYELKIKVSFIGKLMWVFYVMTFASVLFDFYPLVFIILTIMFNFIVLYSYIKQIRK